MDHSKSAGRRLLASCRVAGLVFASLVTGAAASASEGFITTTPGKAGTGGLVPELVGAGPLIVGSPVANAVHISEDQGTGAAAAAEAEAAEAEAAGEAPAADADAGDAADEGGDAAEDKE